MIDKTEKTDEGYSLVTNSQTTMQSEGCGRKYRNLKGMGWLITCLFIVGETAGGGLIAMPGAMVPTGFVGGVLIILFGAIICTVTGIQLSENWTILQERWPEYRNHCRKPYPAMGLRAVGPKFMTFVSVCLNVTMFGTAVVFLLLAATNIENFLRVYFDAHIGFCQLLLIVSICMLPLTMLKSPKDFWWAVIGAMFTTLVAICLIIYASITDLPHCEPRYPAMNPTESFMSFGTVMFAYGGHGVFPTIQHDMKKPYHFRRSVCLAFLIVFCMYLPVCLISYQTYGDYLKDSVILSLQNSSIQQAVNMLITVHVILALTVIFNPLNQELEELLRLPHEFGYKRVVSRSAMMFAVLLVAETVPSFGPMLNLVGGSTITMMALIFPVVFNLFLAAGHKKHNGDIASPDEEPLSLKEVYEYTPKYKLTWNGLILLIALIGSIVATITAIMDMIEFDFKPPCYAGFFGYQESAYQNALEEASVYCCRITNATRFGEPCVDPHNTSMSSQGGHG